MTSKLNISWLNKCRCGNRMHTVETVRGSHVRLFEDDAVKCNSCGREGVIQTFDGIATVLWETDEERSEGAEMTSKSTITREQATDKEIQMLIDSHENGTAMFLRVDAYYLMAKELQERRQADSEPVAYTEKHEISNMHATGLYLRAWPADRARNAVEGYTIPLYLHAQPAPVVPDELLSMAASAIEDLLEHTDPNTSYYSGLWADVPGKLRAAAMLQAGNSPVIPDGYVMVPAKANIEMIRAGGKAAREYMEKYGGNSPQIIYQAMLAAAPQEG